MKGYTDRFCEQCRTYTQQRIVRRRKQWQCLNCDRISEQRRKKMTRDHIKTWCAEYNRLTNPATLKTDDQHAIDNATAATIRRQLGRYVVETDNGTLKPR